MTYFQAIILALVQGVTEFLPISSSGHLILLPRLLSWTDQGLAFDEAVNTGTLLAVMAFFRHDLLGLARGGLQAVARPREITPQGRLAFLLVLATIPAALTGLLIHEWVASEGRNPRLVATTAIVYGVLLWAADRWGSRKRGVEEVGLVDALLIGGAQALSLVPGTSRSGVTMTAGLSLGLTREAAARFSFLLAVPIGLLVAVHDAIALGQRGLSVGELGPLLAAIVVSAVAGYAVIGFLLTWVRRQSMLAFAIYRIALGLLILLST